MDSTVRTWAEQQSDDDVFITAVTAAELLYGVARLPGGRRRRRLAVSIGRMLVTRFSGQVLSFDSPAAVHYASIYAIREKAGRPIGMADAQIAAICRDLSATLATRNVRDFEHTGVAVINPWRASPGTAKV